MSNVKARTRTRSLELDESTKPAGLVPLMIEVYRLNLEQNKAKKAYEVKRGELLGKMKAAKLKRKTAENVIIYEGGNDTVNLEAIVDSPKSFKASVDKLSKLVDPQTFLTIVSATKDAIVTFAGAAVFEQCKEEHTGEENVSVKLIKE